MQRSTSHSFSGPPYMHAHAHRRTASAASAASAASFASFGSGSNMISNAMADGALMAPDASAEAQADVSHELGNVLTMVTFTAGRVLREYARYDTQFDLSEVWRQWQSFATLKQNQLARQAEFHFDYLDPTHLVRLWQLVGAHALPAITPVAAHHANCATLLHFAWQLPLPPARSADNSDASSAAFNVPLDPDQLDGHLDVRDGSQLADAARSFLVHVLPGRWPGLTSAPVLNAYFFLRIRSAMALLGRALQGLDDQVMTRPMTLAECQAALNQVAKASTAERDWAQLVQAGVLSVEEQQFEVDGYLELVGRWTSDVDSILSQYLGSAQAPVASTDAPLGSQAARAIASLRPVSHDAAELTKLVRDFLDHPEYLEPVPGASSVANTSLASLTNRSSVLLPRVGLPQSRYRARSTSFARPTASSLLRPGVRASLPPTLHHNPNRASSTSLSFGQTRRLRSIPPSVPLTARIGERVEFPSDQEEEGVDEDDPHDAGGLSVSQRRSALQEMLEQSSDEEEQAEHESAAMRKGSTMNSLKEQGEAEAEAEQENRAPPPQRQPSLPPRPRVSRPRRRSTSAGKSAQRAPELPDDDQSDQTEEQGEESEYDFQPNEPENRPARPSVLLGATRSDRGSAAAGRNGSEEDVEERLVFGPNHQLFRKRVPVNQLRSILDRPPRSSAPPEPPQDLFSFQGVWPTAGTQNTIAQAPGSPARKRTRSSRSQNQGKGKGKAPARPTKGKGKRLKEPSPTPEQENEEDEQEEEEESSEEEQVPMPKRQRVGTRSGRGASASASVPRHSVGPSKTDAELLVELSVEQRRRALEQLEASPPPTRTRTIRSTSARGRAQSAARSPAKSKGKGRREATPLPDDEEEEEDEDDGLEEEEEEPDQASPPPTAGAKRQRSGKPVRGTSGRPSADRTDAELVAELTVEQRRRALEELDSPPPPTRVTRSASARIRPQPPAPYPVKRRSKGQGKVRREPTPLPDEEEEEEGEEGESDGDEQDQRASTARASARSTRTDNELIADMSVEQRRQALAAMMGSESGSSQDPQRGSHDPSEEEASLGSQGRGRRGVPRGSMGLGPLGQATDDFGQGEGQRESPVPVRLEAPEAAAAPQPEYPSAFMDDDMPALEDGPEPRDGELEHAQEDNPLHLSPPPTVPAVAATATSGPDQRRTTQPRAAHQVTAGGFEDDDNDHHVRRRAEEAREELAQQVTTERVENQRRLALLGTPRPAHAPRMLSARAAQQELENAKRALEFARRGRAIARSPSHEPRIPPKPVVAPRQPTPGPGSPPPEPPKRNPPLVTNGFGCMGRIIWTTEETDTLVTRFAYIAHQREIGSLEARSEPIWNEIRHLHGPDGLYDKALSRFVRGTALRDRLRVLLQQRRNDCLPEPWWVRRYMGWSEHILFKEHRRQQREKLREWERTYGDGDVSDLEEAMSDVDGLPRIDVETLPGDQREFLFSPPPEALVKRSGRDHTTVRELQTFMARCNLAYSGLDIEGTVMYLYNRIRRAGKDVRYIEGIFPFLRGGALAQDGDEDVQPNQLPRVQRTGRRTLAQVRAETGPTERDPSPD